MKNTLSSLACALLLCLGTAAQAALVTFDPPSLIDVNVDPATYDEGGFRLSGPVNTFLPLDGIGSAGSQGLLVFAGNAVKLTAVGGGLFNLLAFDYSAFDLGSGVDPAGKLLVSGLFGGANPLIQELLLDNTGTSFQPWSNLTEVSFFSSADFVLDNINVQAVPEPESLVLVGVGMAALVFIRRRQTRLTASLTMGK